jgi:hypothetical protein
MQMLLAGGSQAQVARLLRIHPNTIQGWVAEKRKMFPGWPDERELAAKSVTALPTSEPEPEPAPEPVTRPGKVFDPYFGWVPVTDTNTSPVVEGRDDATGLPRYRRGTGHV